MAAAPSEFARRLRRLREQSGWTQEELAERSGLSRNYIGLLELGRREPSLSTLLALARALMASLDDLVGPVEPSARTAADSSIFRGPHVSRILETMANCSRTDAETIAGIVESCARLARKR